MPAHSSTSASKDPHGAHLRLREARVEDAETIEAVHYAAREAVYSDRVEEWPPPGPDRAGRVKRWVEWLADPTISCIVGELAGDVAGFCTIRPSQDGDSGDRVAEMPTLYVRPDCWRRGFGRVLCQAGVKRARARGFDELTLWVLEINRRARAFYETFGFAADGATKFDEGAREKLRALRFRMDLRDGAR